MSADPADHPDVHLEMESPTESSHEDLEPDGSPSPSRTQTDRPRYLASVRNGGIGYIDLEGINSTPAVASIVDEDLRDLFDELVNEAARADFKAGFYKFCHQATEVTILSMTTVAGFLGIFDTAQQGVSYAIGALCFTAAGLKSGLEMAGLYKRALIIRGAAAELRALSREARSLLFKQGQLQERIQEYDQLSAKMDEVMMKSFSSDLTAYRSPQARGSSNERFSRVSGRAHHPIPMEAVYN